MSPVPKLKIARPYVHLAPPILPPMSSHMGRIQLKHFPQTRLAGSNDVQRISFTSQMNNRLSQLTASTSPTNQGADISQQVTYGSP